jgi:phytoene dehydrogenase-like protein
MQQSSQPALVVVGGGLAGLAPAALVARRGYAVTLFAKARSVGGRATTQARDGFLLNPGPHALYRRGVGMEVLHGLDIRPDGGVPRPSGGLALAGGRAHTLPGGPVSLLTTGLFGLAAKLEFGRTLAALPRLDPSALGRVSVTEWLARLMRHAAGRGALQALTRLTTYSNAPDEMSAEVALRQVQLGVQHGVLYPHGGWQVLVDGLQAAAQRAGVRIVTGAHVSTLERDRAPEAAVHGVRLADGTVHAARAVVLATTPQHAAELSGDEALATWARAATPVTAACLDVCLRTLPQPRAVFALGIDEPTYVSVHSAVARLAPAGGATLHVARYLAPSEDRGGAEHAVGLERQLDLVQPGWRDLVVQRRFLPRMVVAHALPTARGDGLRGRPGEVVRSVPGLYLAGDWVGAEGLLADASLASARAAAAAVDAAACAVAA